jgi:ABC-type glycerol-3-phosphate transport system substrate-binding protein
MVACNVISAATKQADLAWAFIRFMSATPEGQTLIGQGTYETPVLKDVAHSDAVLKPEWAVPGYDSRVKAAELPGPMYTPYPLNLNLWEFPGKFIDPTIEKLMTGEMTPEEAVAYLDQEGVPYFQKQKQEMRG